LQEEATPCVTLLQQGVYQNNCTGEGGGLNIIGEGRGGRKLAVLGGGKKKLPQNSRLAIMGGRLAIYYS